jgi:hypothetical protein
VRPPTDQVSAPSCPACGYDRTGIASDARCPECGAEGVAASFILVGRERTVTALAWTLALVPQVLFLASVANGFVRRTYPSFRIADLLGSLRSSCIVLVVGAALVLAQILFLVRRATVRARLGPAADQVIWSAYPTGLEIRTSTRRDWIPRGAIRRIDCTDSIFGGSSQLLLIFRATHRLGVVGRTHQLFIDGPKEDRRQRWRSIRAALAIDE